MIVSTLATTSSTASASPSPSSSPAPLPMPPVAPPPEVENTYIIVLKTSAVASASFDASVASLATQIVRANGGAAATLPSSSIARLVAAADASAEEPSAAAASAAPAAVAGIASVAAVGAGPKISVAPVGAKALQDSSGALANTVVHSYDDLGSVAARMTPETAARIAKRADVEAVVRDGPVRIAGKIVRQTAAPGWALARISQREFNTSEADYKYDSSAGDGVTVWVVDTGLNVTDPEFQGRAITGRTFCSSCTSPLDKHGHGTAVAGIVGSKTYGTAKKARLVAVKALNDAGVGQWSDVIAALQWIRANINSPRYRSKRGHVVNLSIEGPINALVNRMLVKLVQAGVTVVVAAGNSAVDACTTSPASATAMSNGIIVVGASDSLDMAASWANFGTCLDIYAPGSEVASLGGDSMSGTSFASPYVAGTLALYLSTSNRVTSRNLKSYAIKQATPDVIMGDLQESPSLLVYNSLTG
ncbi:hypothetical protein H9P43_007482 [Blastocladiella emersonii ATCC 22665]|nr:hypothetical protein H9P43_007482 [Blastocladiella emersonii ATCC 22665]